MPRKVFMVLLYSGLMFALIFTLLSACKNNSPIKIGFAAGLTGRHSDLGLYGRNGVILAFEEANSNGGIHGRPLELIVKDDRQDAATAINVDKELIEEGVIAIIGHFTSAMSVAAVPIINEHKILLFSPTSSTNQLTGKDDYFFRLMSPNTFTNTKIAGHIFDTVGVKNLVIVYDDLNRAFALDWVQSFQEYSLKTQRHLTAIPFVTGREHEIAKLSTEINGLNPDGLLIIASALDAAMLCQQVRKAGSAYPIFTTMWSMTDEFIQHGGNAVEGVTFANWFDPKHPGEESQRFQNNYRARFGRLPTFAAHFSYETAVILINALRENDNPQQLKETLLQRRIFHGAQGDIQMDQFGDAMRELFLMTVKNGQFVRMEQSL